MPKLSMSTDQIRSAIEFYNKGKTFAELAALYNRDESSLRKLLIRRGLKPRTRSHAIRDKNIIHNYFHTIDSEEKAYWLGFIFADGNVYKNNLRIQLKSTDYKHLEKFLRAINSKKEVKFNTSYCPLSGTKTKLCRIHVGSIEMITDLLKYGVVENKSLIACPKNIPMVFEKDFWRGVVDGDGTIGLVIPKNIRHSPHSYIHLIGSYYMIDQFSKFILENSCLSIAPTITRRVNSYTTRTNNKKASLQIINLLYKDATIYLDRKYEKFTQIVSYLE